MNLTSDNRRRQLWRDTLSATIVRKPCQQHIEATDECYYQQLRPKQNTVSQHNNKQCRRRGPRRPADANTHKESRQRQQLLWPSSLMSFSAFLLCQQLICLLALSLLLSVLVVVVEAAPPKSCILCDNDDRSSANEPETSNYEEFLFEHQVSRQDAINALKIFNETYQASNENSCKSIPTCSKTIMKYCLGPQFINDHCWCELGHTEEGLPFVPHICYVGENKVYTASVGSCFVFEELKECCCAKALAKQWRHISSAWQAQPLSLLGLLTLALCIVVRIRLT